jgi:hypothetical protein
MGTAMSTPKSCLRKLGNWANAQFKPNPEHISFWNNTTVQQTKFSQKSGITSHRNKKVVTLMVLGKQH